MKDATTLPLLRRRATFSPSPPKPTVYSDQLSPCTNHSYEVGAIVTLLSAMTASQRLRCVGGGEPGSVLSVAPPGAARGLVRERRCGIPCDGWAVQRTAGDSIRHPFADRSPTRKCRAACHFSVGAGDGLTIIALPAFSPLATVRRASGSPPRSPERSDAAMSCSRTWPSMSPAVVMSRAAQKSG